MQLEISLSFQSTKDGWKLNGSETPASSQKRGRLEFAYMRAKEQKHEADGAGKNNGKKSVGWETMRTVSLTGPRVLFLLRI